MGLAREINWDIVLFMLSIFLVVQGLEDRWRHGLAGFSACDARASFLLFWAFSLQAWL